MECFVIFPELFSCFCLKTLNGFPTNGTPSALNEMSPLFNVYNSTKGTVTDPVYIIQYISHLCSGCLQSLRSRMNHTRVKILPSHVKRCHQFSCTNMQVISLCPDCLEGNVSGLTFMQLSEIHLSKSRIVDVVLQHQY